VAIAIKHLQEEMVPPSAYTPELPHSLEQIILKCTQKSVDRRYQNMEDVIADLKHSLIDPQGDFVKLTSVDTDAKTVVISDKELGEIKHMPKQVSKPEPEALEEEINETDYDDEPEETSRRKKGGRSEKKKKKNGGGHAMTIADHGCDHPCRHYPCSRKSFRTDRKQQRKQFREDRTVRVFQRG